MIGVRGALRDDVCVHSAVGLTSKAHAANECGARTAAGVCNAAFLGRLWVDCGSTGGIVVCCSKG